MIHVEEAMFAQSVLILEHITLFSSVTALILIGVKWIFKCRIPPRVGMALWIVLLARLSWGLYPESRFSIYNVIPAGKQLLIAMNSNERKEYKAAEETQDTPNPYVLTTEKTDSATREERQAEAAPLIAKYTIGYITDSTKGERINRIVIAVYLTGVAVSLCGMSVRYILARKRTLRCTIPVEDERLLAVYRRTAADMGLNPDRLPPLLYGRTTMLAGCFRPVVLCRESDLIRRPIFGRNPAGICEEDTARIVFTHELTHYRSGDNFFLVMTTIMFCLFWYNPLIWVVRKLMREDIEVLCDARTLEFCGIPPTEYALMLCRESAFDTLTAGCAMSVKGRRLKNRLQTIAHTCGRRLLPRTVSWILCGVIFAVCLTDPVLSGSEAYAAYTAHYAALSGEDRFALESMDTVTVSDYLKELRLLLKNVKGAAIPENFGALQHSLDKLALRNPGNEDLAWLNGEIARVEPYDTLTTRSAALISEAIMAVLDVAFDRTPARLSVPEELSVTAMNALLDSLDEEEGRRLLASYNRGVAGAEVSYDACYTEDMMELIRSRIHDPWDRDRFCCYYNRIDLASENRMNISEELSTALDENWSVQCVYVREPNLTKREEQKLSAILGAAMAGQREDMYYLKQTEDVVSREETLALLLEAGFTPLLCLFDRAYTGNFTQSKSAVVLKKSVSAVRGGIAEENVELGASLLSRSRELYRLMDKNYRLGLTEVTESGVPALSEALSGGRCLACAYRFAALLTESEISGE